MMFKVDCTQAKQSLNRLDNVCIPLEQLDRLVLHITLYCVITMVNEGLCFTVLAFTAHVSSTQPDNESDTSQLLLPNGY